MIIEILTGSGGDSVLFARCTGGDSVLVNKKEWGGILSGGDFVLHSDPRVEIFLSPLNTTDGILFLTYPDL